jgi:hypothetical protein
MSGASNQPASPAAITDPRVLAIFLEEVVLQCTFTLQAFNLLQQAVADLTRPPGEVARPRGIDDFDRFREELAREDVVRDQAALRCSFAAQTLLGHAANVSKLLKPISHKAQARGAHLQTLLGVDATWLILDRKVRDSIEHIDERLDAWAAKSVNGSIAYGMIGVTIEGLDPGDQFRTFDPRTLIFTTRGRGQDQGTSPAPNVDDSVNLRVLAEEAGRILAAVLQQRQVAAETENEERIRRALENMESLIAARSEGKSAEEAARIDADLREAYRGFAERQRESFRNRRRS